MKLYDKPCKRCGVMLSQVRATRQYCPECAAIRDKERQAEIRREKREEKRQYDAERRQRKKATIYSGSSIHGLSVEEINHKALEAGLSYGQYIAKVTEENYRIREGHRSE